MNKSELDAYVNLCFRVKEIDENAFLFLMHEAPLLDRFGLHGSLGYCFLWDATPQGHSYWYNIAEKLGERG